VTVVCSVQYRVMKQNADDAFYELQNPREQIQSYVFDGEAPLSNVRAGSRDRAPFSLASLLPLDWNDKRLPFGHAGRC